MAFREIPEEAFVPYLKLGQVFQKVGDKFYGIYNSQSEGDYGTNFVFATAIGSFSLTVRGALKKQLDAAGLNGGELVMIQFAKTVDTGKENPMRSFKVMIDDEYKGAPPKNGANVVIPRREPAPAPAAEDDLPF
jgi:hypothetical protein